MIVDTHVHVLAADRAKYPRQLREVIPPNFAWTREDYTAEDLIADMDRSGLARALLVQAQNAYRSDNSYVVDMAEKYPDRCIQKSDVHPTLAFAEQHLTPTKKFSHVAGWLHELFERHQ